MYLTHKYEHSDGDCNNRFCWAIKVLYRLLRHSFDCRGNEGIFQTYVLLYSVVTTLFLLYQLIPPLIQYPGTSAVAIAQPAS